MTAEKIGRINAQRVMNWEESLTAHHATAAILIGVGHDHVAGTLHIQAVDLPDEMLCAYLGQAMAVIRLRMEAERKVPA